MPEIPHPHNLERREALTSFPQFICSLNIIEVIEVIEHLFWTHSGHIKVSTITELTF